MKRLIAAAAAAVAICCAGAANAATIYTGTLDGPFYVSHVEGPWGPTATRRFTFEADMSQISDLQVTLHTRNQFAIFAGDKVYYDVIDIYEAPPIALTPTGFTVTVRTDANEGCDPVQQAPSFRCDYIFFDQLYLMGTASGSIAYKMTVSVVPEPATWGLMIAGFGLTGSMLRYSRTGRSGLVRA